jgi:uncharacterized protein (TIGR00255 family)
MINSMTGYGCAKGNIDKLELTIELKSVNNRFFDCSVKIPRLYAFAEDTVKTQVQSCVNRGKVDVFINIDSSKSNDVTIKLNEPLLEAYLSAFKVMSEKYAVVNDIGTAALSRLPDIFIIEKQEVDTDRFLKGLREILGQALESFNAMRAEEGKKLNAFLETRLSEIERISAQIEERSPQSVADYRMKLEARMAEVLANTSIDEARILTEAAIFADKVAISEELVRLSSHISQARMLLQSGQGVGRKLDFIVQELNRESNTIGSKCSDLVITRMVVDLKAEIEKIREQAQNIE